MTTSTNRHERELAEVKALAQELDRSVQEGLEQVERTDEAQGQRGAGPPVAGNGAESLLAFVHIPKTAGGTVLSMLTAAFSKQGVKKTGNYVRNPEKTGRKISSSLRREGQVSAGHTPYGALRAHMPPDTRYMTFLREPVDRVLSHYYRHIHIRDPDRAARQRAKPRQQPSQGWRAKAGSIEEALVEMRLPQISNLATRFLSGKPLPPMEGDLPPSALDDAKRSLSRFTLIGIQERFEESLVLLQRVLGLGSIPYRDRHVSSGDSRPAVDEIPDEQRALIEEYNALDAELYKFGLGLFDEAVAAADDGFAADVESLRARSATAREEEWHEARASG